MYTLILILAIFFAVLFIWKGHESNRKRSESGVDYYNKLFKNT